MILKRITQFVSPNSFECFTFIKSQGAAGTFIGKILGAVLSNGCGSRFGVAVADVAILGETSSWNLKGFKPFEKKAK